MKQAYDIDRLNLITYRGQKKKVIKSLYCRYLAKSHVVNCSAQSQTFYFVNFRGSCFTKTDFKNAVFYGCDFWGASFKSCFFQNAQFRGCVFMSCRFKSCDFSGTRFSYSTIVNTSLTGCHNIDVSSGARIYSIYPTCKMSDSLIAALQSLKGNRNLKKNKLLFISDTNYNQLNLFLLQKRYGDNLPALLCKLSTYSTVKITTYKKLERVLNKMQFSAII